MGKEVATINHEAAPNAQFEPDALIILPFVREGYSSAPLMTGVKAVIQFEKSAKVSCGLGSSASFAVLRRVDEGVGTVLPLSTSRTVGRWKRRMRGVSRIEGIRP